jgi:hypothetical protein
MNPRRLPFLSPLVLLLLFAILTFSPTPALSQSAQPSEQLHSVLSQSILNPPLRSPEVSLRFSHNGKYLLVQDPSGVNVMSTKPLAMLIRIGAVDLYPAQFSADSQSFTVVSSSLTYGTWSLPGAQKIAGGNLPVGDSCLDGQLSPDSQFLACVSPKFNFKLLEISSQKVIFAESLFMVLSSNLRSTVRYPVLNLFSLDTNFAFARPFGLVLASPPRASPGRSFTSSNIYFTPDSKALLVNTAQASLGFDLATGKKFDVSDRFRKLVTGSVAFQNIDAVVGIDRSKDKEPESLLFNPRNGKISSKLPFTADRVCLASNPRYAVLYTLESGAHVARTFDLKENRPLNVPPNASMDVFEDVMAVYNAGGFVALYRLEDQKLISTLRLPLGVPLLSAASVTPDFSQLAISVDGAGAFFQVSDGKRLSSSTKFTAVGFLGKQDAILLVPASNRNPAHILHLNVSNGESSPSWEVSKGVTLHSNGPALLEYSVDTQTPRASLRDLQDSQGAETQVPFRLRAVDIANGRELWKRDFNKDSPTPFADPQGDRFILGWRAKSSGAREAASRNPALKLTYKNTKLADDDSYFEALDVRSGQSVGGILVQSGTGPLSYDSAFSVGDSLVLVKDNVRVSLYSLADGTLKAKLVGTVPALSAENNLLALYLSSGHLAIYDSNTGSKLDQEPFPEGIAYAHFSADGQKIFVLTESQSAVVLDLAKVREPRAPEAPRRKLEIEKNR